MMRRISHLILKLWGWKVIFKPKGKLEKCVVVVAPHTSNWDFVVGRLAYFSLGYQPRILIKKESFFFPMGYILKKLGSIPVDRGHSSKLVDEVAEIFIKRSSLFLTITPEGTRSLVTRWKRGFYYIAHKANVPIALAVLDYKNKIVGVDQVFIPTGNFEKDFKYIEDFYRGSHARHPEKFNLS